MSTSAPAKEVFLAVIPEDTSDGLKVFIWNDELFYSTMSAQHTAKETLYNLQYPQHLFLQSLESERPVPCIKVHTKIIVLLCAWFFLLSAKSRNHSR